MIEYKIEFELAAIVLDLIIVLFYYQRRNYPTSAGMFYKRIMLVALVSSITNVLSARMMTHFDSFPLWLHYLINIAYFSFQNVLATVFVLYSIAFTEIKSTIESKAKKYAYILMVVVVLIIISTPLTHTTFYFDEAGNYFWGPFVYVFYALSFMELAASGIIAWKQRKKVSSSRKCSSIIIFVVMLLSAVAFQFLCQEILVTGFMISCACLIMYMILQNLFDGRVDKTKLYKKDEFLVAISESFRSEKGFYVVSIVPENVSNLMSVAGPEPFLNLMGQIGDFMTGEFGTEAYYTEEGAVTVIMDNPVDVRAVERTINKRFESPWVCNGILIQRPCRIAYTGYPNPIDRIEDLIAAVDYMISKVKNDSDENVFFARGVPKVNERVNQLEAEKELLEAESFEAMLARDRAEKENKLKNVFMANMSHEVRTPMNAILGMTTLVLKDDINPRVRDMMEDIQRAGESLLAIVNDLLDITKIESDKFELIKKDFSLKTLIMDAVSVSSMRIQDQNLEMFVEIDNTVPDMVNGDDNRLKQVFVNLLNNGIKYTSHGYVKLEVTGEYDAERPGNYILRAMVSDTGSGIKEKDMNKLFNTFSRALNEENANVEGTGLGLAICKKIVTLMNGDIGVKSKFGEGSTFSFYVSLPCSSKETIINHELAKTKSVIICGENRYDRRIDRLKNVLYSMEIPYYVYDNAEEAVQRISAGKITDIIITKTLYLQKKQYFDESKVHLIMLYSKNQTYDDVTNAGIIYEPLYSLNLQRLLEEKKTDKPKNAAYKAPASSKVLVVDDNLVNLKVISALLKQFGITAEQAASGPESIDKAGANNYDLIFMDHMMPEMDGIEAMKHIRELSSIHAKMPIVMLTANAINGAEEMFKSMNFDDYVSKPVNMAKLEEVLRKFLGEAEKSE